MWNFFENGHLTILAKHILTSCTKPDGLILLSKILDVNLFKPFSRLNEIENQVGYRICCQWIIRM